MTSTRQMVIMLFVVAVVCAVVLSCVYAFTAPRIADTQMKLTLAGLEQVIDAERFVEIVPDTLWQALDSLGNQVGIVFRVFPQGYGGPIPVTVGLDAGQRITGIKVATAAEGLTETPGLGAKITGDDFTGQFKGKCADDVALQKDGGAIQAITAATISSRAVAAGVRKGIDMYGSSLAPSCDPRAVFPEADAFREIIKDTLWQAMRGEAAAGIVFVGAVMGYLDTIRFMVGSTADGQITGVAILYSQETEGIGEVIRDHEFLDKFKAGIPDAISGATVSSRALINGVVDGIERFKEYLK
ncbi:FMN-binding protein [candidate division WOR-3 bacterium]|nr:FMN-binding protein [candidate division WOR-3 bacterium]